jgi:hypothetical protein
VLDGKLEDCEIEVAAALYDSLADPAAELKLAISVLEEKLRPSILDRLDDSILDRRDETPADDGTYALAELERIAWL